MTDMASSASPAGVADLRAASGGSGRLAAAARIATLALIGLGWLWIGLAIATNLSNPAFGLDYRWHIEAAQRLLDTGTPYLPFELSGPFVIGDGAILYPPTAFLLFIPFIWLPAVLWWAIPIAITAYCLWWHRPPLWAWVIITALFAFDKSINVYVFGNPSMWMVAAIAAGTVWRWPFVFVLAKPTFAPIALLGIRHRSWWIALGVLAVASLPFLAGLVRLDHGRPQFGRVAALQPADIAARPGPARGLGDRSGSTVVAAPAPAEVIATERWPERADLRHWSPVRFLLVLATGLLVAEVVISFTMIRDAGELWIDYTFYRQLGARWLADGPTTCPTS